MKERLILIFVVLLSGCASHPEDDRPYSSPYAGEDLVAEPRVPLTRGEGIKSIRDPRFPDAMFPLIRKRWNKSSTFETSRGEYPHAWVTAWQAAGSNGPGYVAVFSITMETVNSRGDINVMRNQTYKVGDEVWGGWWRYDDEKWFSLGKTHGQDTFEVKKLTDEMEPAVIMDTARFAHEPSAGHIWPKDWPRLKLPEDAIQIRVRVVARAFGDAMFHFGLDQYSEPADPEEKSFEPMGSDSYAAEHGMVDAIIAIRVRRD